MFWENDRSFKCQRSVQNIQISSVNEWDLKFTEENEVDTIRFCTLSPNIVYFTINLRINGTKTPNNITQISIEDKLMIYFVICNLAIFLSIILIY